MNALGIIMKSQVVFLSRVVYGILTGVDIVGDIIRQLAPLISTVILI